MFLDCPAYMDKSGSVRCGLPAEVEGRYLMSSTDGPLESARIRCPRGHWFNGPVESLTLDEDASVADQAISRIKGAAVRPPRPYVVAAGSTRQETKQLMVEAMAGHIALLREAGQPVPEPSDSDSVTVLDPTAA
jgi:predicted RNase H-like HicB family nuclease